MPYAWDMFLKIYKISKRYVLRMKNKIMKISRKSIICKKIGDEVKYFAKLELIEFRNAP